MSKSKPQLVEEEKSRQGYDDRDCLIARSRPRSLFGDRDSDRDELKKTRPGPGSHD
jgi:hypothetical protein